MMFDLAQNGGKTSHFVISVLVLLLSLIFGQVQNEHMTVYCQIRFVVTAILVSA